MRLFITGGTGFIGSHVLRLAAARGDRVTATRRHTSSQPRIMLGDATPNWLDVALDMLEPDDLRGHDAVLHLASVGVSPQQASLDELVRWNIGATVRLIEIAAAANVRRVVIAGSFAEYGRSADRFEFLPTTASLEPTSPYAASKAAACMLAFALAAQHNLELCYLRIFSAFGEGQHESNFFPSLTRAAQSGADFPMTAGEQVRDFVPVADVAHKLLNATSRKDVVPGVPLVSNVASGQPVTLRSFAESWWQHLGARGHLLVGALPYRSTEPKRFAAVLDSPLTTITVPQA